MPEGKRKREKRALLSTAEEAVVEDVIRELGDCLGVRLTFSDVARSSLFLLTDALPLLMRGLPEACDLRRPPTRNPKRTEEFERTLRSVLFNALRDGSLRDLPAEEGNRAFAERFEKRLLARQEATNWRSYLRSRQQEATE